MCYSEFTDIIPAIDNMDADVISFEASRSDLEILDELKAKNPKQKLTWVYDIHQLVCLMKAKSTTHEAILAKVPSKKVWINPRLWFETRGTQKRKKAWSCLVEAAKAAREKLWRKDSSSTQLISKKSTRKVIAYVASNTVTLIWSFPPNPAVGNDKLLQPERHAGLHHTSLCNCLQ